MCIKFPQPVIDQITQIEFPFDNIDEFTGIDTKSIIILSDYAGETSNFETFAYYITDWNHCGTLVKALKRVKKTYGISERTICYKGRKDRLKCRAFEDWMQIVKSYPGIICVFAYDNSMKTESLYLKDLLKCKNEMAGYDLYDNVGIAQKMWKALSLAVLWPKLFKDKHRVAWVSDDDDIFGTKKRTGAFFDTLDDMCSRIEAPKLKKFGLATPFDDKKEFDMFEEMLSIPDMAAGAFAASLCYAEDGVVCPDEETAKIIEEFAVIPRISQFVKRGNLYPLFHCGLLKVAYTAAGEPYYRLFERRLEKVLRGITSGEFRKWLSKHHLIALDVWVEFVEGREGEGLITHEQAVAEAAKYGWEKKDEKTARDGVNGWKFAPKSL